MVGAAESGHHKEYMNSDEPELTKVYALIEQMRSGSLSSLRHLSQSLTQLDIPGMLPIMKPLLEDRNTDLSLAAYDWLARTRNQNASAILLAKFEAGESTKNEKGLAVEALGRRGDASALQPIRRLAGQLLRTSADPAKPAGLCVANIDDATARLLIRLAVSEAMLGGRDLASIPIDLAFGDMPQREAIVRVEAVSALRSVTGPRLLEALRNALLDENLEVAESAIFPLQLIGAKEAVDTLVDAILPERMDLAELALGGIVAITGQTSVADRNIYDIGPDELRRWWATLRPKFQTGMCYRLGKPFSVATIVELLRDPNQRPAASEELWIITHFDCAYNDDLAAEEQDSVSLRAETWLATHGLKYKLGVLYKYGQERSLRELV
jgi:hypothetical protein